MEQALAWASSSADRRLNKEDCNLITINSSASTPFVSAPCSPRSSSSTNMAAFYSSNTPTRPVRASVDIRTSPDTGMAFVMMPSCWESAGSKHIVNGESEADQELVSFSAVGSDDFDFSARFSEADQPWSPAPMSSADELFCNGQIRPLWFNSPQEFNNHTTAAKAALSEDGNYFDFRSSADYTSSSAAPRSPPTSNDKLQRFVGYSHNRPSDDQGILPGLNHHKQEGPTARANVQKSDSNGHKLVPNGLKLRPNEHTILGSNNEAGIQQATAVNVEDRGRRRADKELGWGHRRNRSLSPLRVFHMDDDHLTRQSFETDQSFHSAKTNVEEEDQIKANKVHWTLLDLLHDTSDDQADSLSSKRKQKKAATRQTQEKGGASMAHKDKVKVRSPLWFSPIKLSPMHGLDKIKGSNHDSRSPNHLSGKQQPLSPHELHYASQRAQSEQMKRRTFLPYRHGLLGCLGFTSESYRSVAGTRIFHSKP